VSRLFDINVLGEVNVRRKAPGPPVGVESQASRLLPVQRRAMDHMRMFKNSIPMNLLNDFEGSF